MLSFKPILAPFYLYAILDYYYIRLLECTYRKSTNSVIQKLQGFTTQSIPTPSHMTLVSIPTIAVQTVQLIVISPLCTCKRVSFIYYNKSLCTHLLPMVLS